MSNPKYCIVYITVPNEDAAQKITKALLKDKLAACVSKVPGLVSTYVWKGNIDSSQEDLLLVKTKTSLMSELTANVKKNHPYEVPEIVAVPLLEEGNPDYFKWIDENTK